VSVVVRGGVGVRSWLVLGLMLCDAARAGASDFRVNPVQIVLSPATSTALFTVHNDGSEPLRFQVTAFAWTQSATDDMELVQTEDVVVFPTLFAVGAGEVRNVRLGSATSFGSAEKSYRVFFEELPSDTIEKIGRSPRIPILTKMGIPVFLTPVGASPDPTLREMAIHHGRLSFQVSNPGTEHLMLQAVRVKGLGTTGDVIFEQEIDGWYVLAGASRAYTVDIPRARCAQVRTLAVEARTDRQTLRTAVDVPGGSCGS
jgi:fimbrial chaperone protein